MTYLNVVEVESGLAALASAYPSLTELIPLPEPSYEGRSMQALRIGTDPTADAVILTACQHAREWGGAEVCLYFAADLLEAYSTGTGLTYGAKSFSWLTVRRIVRALNVVVLPCANPDGRAFDQAHDALWRKNRNPASSGGDPNRVGVDLNRNHDFLWDFRTAFSPGANPGTLASDDPLSEIYHGTSPASEPESRNIRWLLDRFRFARWMVDIHSYSGDNLYSWGDDLDQSDTPSMNFRSTAWNGQRGVTGGYGEYISPSDHTVAQGVAQRMVNAINIVRGGHYVTLQSVSLRGSPGQVSYPTSGAVDDYAFSRHLVDCTKAKVHAFTIEFGYWRGDFRSSFHPPWPEMQNIVLEIDAGLLELCDAVAPTWRWPWYVLFRRLWPWQIWDPMARLAAPVWRDVLRRIISSSQPGP